ncbi:hypothetical protein BDZ97DRAFT_832932 [Flammula alnicola]|nr:hypothetical protein BDZ97DRAFT_832932 [Flammula alnicola]
MEALTSHYKGREPTIKETRHDPPTFILTPPSTKKLLAMAFLSVFKFKKNTKLIKSADMATAAIPASSRTSTASTPPSPATMAPAPIQNFEGSQEFHGELTNNNGGDSAAFRAAPAQSFSGSQKFYGTVTNNNGVHENNNNVNSGNSNSVIGGDTVYVIGMRGGQPQLAIPQHVLKQRAIAGMTPMYNPVQGNIRVAQHN